MGQALLQFGRLCVAEPCAGSVTCFSPQLFQLLTRGLPRAHKANRDGACVRERSHKQLRPMTLEDQFALWLEPSRRRLYSESFIDRWDEDRQVELEIEQQIEEWSSYCI